MVSQRLSSYFGSSPQAPCFHLHAPSHASIPASPSSSPPVPSPTSNGTTCPTLPQRTIDILLLSSTDGRDTLVDLTRTLAEMSQCHKLHPRDITQDLINAELAATTTISPSSHTPTFSQSPQNDVSQHHHINQRPRPPHHLRPLRKTRRLPPLAGTPNGNLLRRRFRRREQWAQWRQGRVSRVPEGIVQVCWCGDAVREMRKICSLGIPNFPNRDLDEL